MTANAVRPRSTSSASNESSTSGISSAAIVEVEGQDPTQAGADRRGAVAVAFALCLAVGSATVARDGPEATAPVEPPRVLTVSRDASDVVLFAFPDRLANEPLPNLPFVTVTVRGTEGLAVTTSESSRAQGWLITWTERGTVYSLSSDRRDLSDLLRVAGSLH